MMKHALAAAAFALALSPAAPAAAVPAFTSSGDAAFDAWRDGFAARAIAAGHAPELVERLLGGLAPDLKVIELDRNQPEFVRPPWSYIESATAASRIEAGRRLRGESAQLFANIETAYGVDADIIAGIWGVETNYGTFPLRHDAAQTLATLAYEGRRRTQFEGFLLALFEMVSRGHAGPSDLKSSWAGALGQPQFMPDIYLRYAVDWSGDGRRDIWNDRGDVLASIANYLKERGWTPGGPVFEEARLPEGFDYGLADEIARPLAYWRELGVAAIGGEPWGAEQEGLSAELWLPAGRNGPALLLFPNFQVIKSYNPSDRYALAVALLARGFEGRPLLQTPWPKQEGYLERAEVLELQRRLNELRHPAGAVDGMFGASTRRAIRSFQMERGLPADGYPTPALLNTVRRMTGEAPAAAEATLTANPEPIVREVTPEPPKPKLKPRPTRSKLLAYAEVKTLQRLLGRLGYKVGKIDGDPGAQTKAAIREFEASLGYQPTGRVDAFILAQARRAAR